MSMLMTFACQGSQCLLLAQGSQGLLLAKVLVEAEAGMLIIPVRLGWHLGPMLYNNTAENYHGTFNPTFSRVKIPW
jgi:hypothetical protein